MGKCRQASGSQQNAVETPSVRFPFQLPLGLWGRTVKIVIGALGSRGLAFLCQEGEILCFPAVVPPLALSTNWSSSC